MRRGKKKAGRNSLGWIKSVPPKISEPLSPQGTEGQARAPKKERRQTSGHTAKYPVTRSETPEEIRRVRQGSSRGNDWRNSPKNLEPTTKISKILRKKRTPKNRAEPSRVCTDRTRLRS